MHVRTGVHLAGRKSVGRGGGGGGGGGGVVLILKPSSLVDVIHALPVLRLLKLHYPGAEIFWWIDSALAPLIEGDPDLAGVVRFERKRWGEPRHWPEMPRSTAAANA